MESAHKAESAQERRICTKKQNLYKKVESAQESRICTNNGEEKHLTIRCFSYLNTTTRCSSIYDICDVQLKTQICTTPDICNLSYLTTTMMDCAYGLNISMHIYGSLKISYSITLNFTYLPTPRATESHRKTLN